MKFLGSPIPTGVWHVKVDSMVMTVPVGNLKEVVSEGLRPPGPELLQVARYFKRLNQNHGDRPVYHWENQEFM
jgi:hypothetical protein